MTRFMLPAPLMLLLAACGGGDDRSAPEDSSAIGPAQKAAPEAGMPVDADLPDAEPAPEAPPETATPAADGRTIPPAIRGRWALKAADCAARRGTDLTALVIDATNLRFFESHGELAQVRESDATHVVADYKFSGEGLEWDRRMRLELADGGKALVRRDEGEGAVREAMRYTRCAG